MVMVAPRSSRKSTYASWLHYVDKEEGSQSDYVVEEFLAYLVSWMSVQEDQRMASAIYLPATTRSQRAQSSPCLLCVWAPCIEWTDMSRISQSQLDAKTWWRTHIQAYLRCFHGRVSLSASEASRVSRLVHRDGDTSRRLKVKKTTQNYKPRAWSWQNMKPLANKSLTKIIDDGKKFFFSPYTYTPRGVVP